MKLFFWPDLRFIMYLLIQAISARRQHNPVPAVRIPEIQRQKVSDKGVLKVLRLDFGRTGQSRIGRNAGNCPVIFDGPQELPSNSCGRRGRPKSPQRRADQNRRGSKLTLGDDLHDTSGRVVALCNLSRVGARVLTP